MRPRIAHELDYLEPLAEVQVLLVGDDVEAAGKVVRVLAVERGGDVARGVERGAVAAQDDAGRHLVGGQVDDLRALVELEQPLLAQLVHDAAHLVVVKALAGIAVETDVHEREHLLHLGERDLLEPVEQRGGLRVAVLDLFEPGAGPVVERLVALGLPVEAHVELDQLVHAAALDGFAVAPGLVGADHLAELRAPVAQVVDAHAVIAHVVVDAVERVADHGAGQVPDVQRLGDVDRRIVDAHVAPGAHVAAAVAVALAGDALQHGARLRGAVEREIDIAAGGLGAADALRQRERGGGLLRDERRRLAQRLCELEARERKVPEVRVGRRLQHCGDLVGGKAALPRGHGRERRGDRLSKLHTCLLPLSIRFFHYSKGFRSC